MKLGILAGVLVVLGLAGILVSTILRVHQHYRYVETDYGIIMDAGSTSTQVYIYEWERKINNYLPTITVSLSEDNVARIYKARPGIAELETPNVTAVGAYLDPILEWASSIIPDNKQGDTPIFFSATGGVRELSETMQGALLASVRSKLQQSGFKYDSTFTTILSGAEEAGFGFLAVNGLYNKFDFQEQSSDANTYGSLDMGGISAEIAFISPDHPPANYSFATDINGTAIELWAQSIDGLGINEARFAFNASLFLLNNNTDKFTVYDPCAPTGYYENATFIDDGKIYEYLLQGSSNADQCSALVNDLVAKLTGLLPVPPIGSTTFVVADHYIDVKKFYKLKDNANILELAQKTNSFCSLSYGDAMNHHNHYENDVQYYCFMGNYIASLLRDYYGFSSTLRHILWKESINKTPVTWTLGSVMTYVDQLTPDTSDQIKTNFIRFFRTAGGTVTLFVSCLLVILGLVLFILQRRRPSEYVPIR